MNFIYLIITIFSLLSFSITQLSVNTKPHSIIKKINNNVPIFIAPVLNLSEILKKDILDLEKG